MRWPTEGHRPVPSCKSSRSNTCAGTLPPSVNRHRRIPRHVSKAAWQHSNLDKRPTFQTTEAFHPFLPSDSHQGHFRSVPGLIYGVSAYVTVTSNTTNKMGSTATITGTLNWEVSGFNGEPGMCHDTAWTLQIDIINIIKKKKKENNWDNCYQLG